MAQDRPGSAQQGDIRPQDDEDEGQQRELPATRHAVSRDDVTIIALILHVRIPFYQTR